MKKAFIFLFIAAAINISFAQQEFVYPSVNPTSSISFPNDWTVNTDETSLEAFPTDQSIYYGIVVLQAHNVEAAINAADEAVTGMFTSITYDDPKEGEYDGIRFVFIEGLGILDEVGECDLDFIVHSFKKL